MAARSTRPGSISALRAANERAILGTLLSLGSATQAELARRTGLSNGTVSSVIKDFVARELVETSATVSSGRKAMLVTPTFGGRRVAVGIDLGRAHLGIAIVRPGNELLIEDRQTLSVDTSAPDALAAARRLLDATLARIDRTRDDIIGTGFGIPGPIDAATREVADESILPSWVGHSASDIEQALGLPVVVGNDADLGTIAERAWGGASDTSNFMFVKVGTGIGGGLFLAGASYTGSFGVSGEIGHTVIDPTGSHCRCGNRGCLETVASSRVIVQHVSAAMGRDVPLDEIVQLAKDGNLATVRVLAEAGAALGQALAAAVNLLGVDHIVLSGTVVESGEALLDPVRAGLSRFAISSLAHRVVVEASALGERGSALGAATMAIQHTGEISSLLNAIR